MEILKGVLVVLHIIGFAAVFGGALSQLPAAKKGRAVIITGVFHGLNTMLVSGLLLVVMKYALVEPVDNLKISLKLVVFITMVVVVLLHRKRQGVPASVLALIAGLGVLNVAIAVLWG